jgi:hypothetical protein
MTAHQGVARYVVQNGKPLEDELVSVLVLELVLVLVLVDGFKAGVCYRVLWRPH